MGYGCTILWSLKLWPSSEVTVKSTFYPPARRCQSAIILRNGQSGRATIIRSQFFFHLLQDQHSDYLCHDVSSLMQTLATVHSSFSSLGLTSDSIPRVPPKEIIAGRATT
jgi:hypothetical protein